MEARIAARRRAIARAASRRRVRRVLLVLGLAAIGATAWWVVAHSPFLDVDLVAVTPTAHVPQGEVIVAAGIVPGTALVTLDTGAVEAAVEAMPRVADASVRRDWPGTLRVAVAERVPVARLGGLLVDAGGHAFPAGGDENLFSFPELRVPGVSALRDGAGVDETALAALTVAASIPPDLATRVEAVVAKAPLEVGLVLAGDAHVLVGGTDGVGARLDVLAELLAVAGGEARYFDIRAGARPVAGYDVSTETTEVAQ